MKQKTKRLICALVSASLILPGISGMGFADESSSEPSGNPGVKIEEQFPDETLRGYVSNNLDGNADGYLSQEEIDEVKYVSLEDTKYQSIASIEGLEIFTNLRELSLRNNKNISEFNASVFPELEELTLWESNVKTIDVSGNKKLSYLDCDDTPNLKEIDVSNNPVLETLYCDDSGVESLKLGVKPSLDSLWTKGSKLTDVDVSDCPWIVREIEKGSKNFYVSGGQEYVEWDGEDAGFGVNSAVNVTYRKNVNRLAGADRFETSILAAERLRYELGDSNFNNIIVASGAAFPDALSGSALAAVKDAPILLTAAGKAEDNVIDYIVSHISTSGTVYILGGTGAVSESFEEKLTQKADEYFKDSDLRAIDSENIHIKRLAGATRFETNLAILEEADYDDTPVLVARADQFADALSASATGLPILLVGKSLDDAQKEYLSSLSEGMPIFVVGGTGAVSEDIEKALEEYGTVKRIAGQNRYETSVELASLTDRYSGQYVFAYGENFPDGLSAGPLAYFMGAPLILTQNSAKAYGCFRDYLDEDRTSEEFAVDNAVVLGGETLIGDASLYEMFRTYVLKGIAEEIGFARS